MAGILAIMLAAAAFAGSLNPPTGGGPGVSGGPGAMYTLEDIYQRLATGAAGTKRSGPFAESGASPAATGHTLNDVYNLIGMRVFVPRTGQTGCWDASGVAIACTGTGQDGDKLKGVANPSPRFTAANGTVTDNLTGLIWLQNADCANATRTWQDALYDVVNLNTDGTMNSNNCSDTSNSGSHQADWRLPNVKELQSLIDFQNVSPALPTGHLFSSVRMNYWSATSLADITSFAWNVWLRYGNVEYNNKWDTRYVWPVRGGQ